MSLSKDPNEEGSPLIFSEHDTVHILCVSRRVGVIFLFLNSGSEKLHIEVRGYICPVPL